MQRRIDTRSYPASAYDREWCLKQPGLLWVAVLFLDRALLLPLLMGAGHYANVNPDALSSVRGLWGVEGLLPSLLTLPVVLAAWRRIPKAGELLRWSWRQGRALLILAALLDALLNTRATLRAGDAAMPLLAAALDVYVIAYIALTRRVREAFGDFPPRQAVDGVDPHTTR